MDASTPSARFQQEYLQHRQRQPFPWQLAAAERLGGHWPRLSYVNVPTGCGKTCVIDLWHSCSPRRRLAYVINRRIVVDTVYGYAKKLPVTVEHMRGGLPPDERAQWWLKPEDRQVLVSTIDQVGSALLGQAYGHGPKAAPVLQGLVGTDALWVVDEAHLETPFVKTLLACQQAGADIDILLMSATPEDLPAGIPVIGLAEADRLHPVLSRRVRADRVQNPPHQPKGKGPAALAEEAKRLRGLGSQVVLVVCNTVKTARQTFERLRQDGEAILVTGRVRPADRDRQLKEHLPRILSGTRRAEPGPAYGQGLSGASPPGDTGPRRRKKNMAAKQAETQLDLFDSPSETPSAQRVPLYVVATSAIEVGADIDCDALVGEECGKSQQTQREGRVNRLGELDCAPVSVLKPEKEFKLKQPVSPLWLPDDFAVTFDPAPWLHGYGEDFGTVDVVWRKDLPQDAAEQEDYFAVLPVMTHECMPVPRWSFAQWLKERGHPAVWLDRGTVVLRSECGGADEWGWNPDATKPVSDEAERYDVDEEGRPTRIVRIRLDEDAAVPAGLKAQAIPGGSGQRVAYPPRQWKLGKQPVLLKDHLRAVGDEAAQLAQALGRDPAVFRKAGRCHDIGKLDPDFQFWLGGDATRLLAKSGSASDSRRKIAGVPKGWRHEFAGVEKLLGKADPLLCYLVGTHHGHGRPWFNPPHETPLPWVELVLALRRQHNPWRLAALEGILRIADWRVSMRGG